MHQNGFLSIVGIILLLVITTGGTYLVLTEDYDFSEILRKPEIISPPSPKPEPDPRPIPKPLPVPIPEPTPVPTPIPLPEATTTLSIADLKYIIMDRFGDIHFCDPDYYPVARADENDLAAEKFPEIQKDVEVFLAILKHENIGLRSSYASEEKLRIYREYKKLNVFTLKPGNFPGTYAFNYIVTDPKHTAMGTGITYLGTIDMSGSISNIGERKSYITTCPICLPSFTLIETPWRNVPISELRENDLVWSTNAQGERILARVAFAYKIKTPPEHTLLRIKFSNDKSITGSPGHPLANGKRFGALKLKERVHDANIISIERIPHGNSYTYDILLKTGAQTYWSNGILLKSTLALPL